MSERLKPCPFECDAVNPPFVQTDDTLHYARHAVQCDRCGASGPRCQTQRQAILAWNARTPTNPGEMK